MSSLPPLPLQRQDGLSPGAKRTLTVGVLSVQALACWGLLQLDGVRAAVAEVAPLMVDIVKPPPPPPPATPPPPAPPRPPQVVKPRVLAAAPTPSPQPPAFVAPPPAPVPEPAPVPVAAPAPPSPPAPPAAPLAPIGVDLRAVSFISPPSVVYPAISRRNKEGGTVMLRLVVSAQGLPQRVEIQRSSGFEALDQAALASLEHTRFKPYTVDGVPRDFWVVLPFNFDPYKASGKP